MRKKPLERTIKRPFRILRHRSRVETVSALVTANGNQRRNPLLKIAMVVFEAGNRIIAAIGHGYNRTSCTKIDSKPHAYSLPAFLPEGVPPVGYFLRTSAFEPNPVRGPLLSCSRTRLVFAIEKPVS